MERAADKPGARAATEYNSSLAVRMQNRIFAVIGSGLIVIGVAALIHPQFSYRVSQHVEQTGPMKVEYETRRIIRLPLWFSIPILTIGAALVIGGLRKE